ncbi:DoxX family protein [Pedobacter frigiditerrae]|uniref:DoxX family protein n=1 Tax=Pedobacter frigiditerrae TaxID=2530452 RepID=A0A4R0MVZ7_9SPHI|nr:DoxX family protein [Pedobacter frigiditerrae]TCC90094.1 DoxX family protein [Pedobacter frigiditerrae]
MTKNQPFLRIALIIIFLAHAVPGIFNNGINDFGNQYLNGAGFKPFGLALAWAIKMSHVAFVFSLISNKYLKLSSAITIIVLIVGIFMIHLKEGWFVVGGGRNGVEFNFLLICCIMSILHQQGHLTFKRQAQINNTN